MRANAVGLICAAGLLALVPSFAPGDDAVVPASEYSSHPMTAEELDCIVGGRASCFDEGQLALFTCLLEEGVNVEDPESVGSNYAAVGYCSLVAVKTIVGCVLDYLWGLIF